MKDIILRYDALEKDLSSADIEPKLLAKKSKEYSNLGNIISIAKEYNWGESDFENAKLIAQAPELLTKLRQVLSCIDAKTDYQKQVFDWTYS